MLGLQKQFIKLGSHVYKTQFMRASPVLYEVSICKRIIGK